MTIYLVEWQPLIPNTQGDTIGYYMHCRVPFVSKEKAEEFKAKLDAGADLIGLDNFLVEINEEEAE
jgi:hypothetical protein